ncbi:protein of unknown function [Azospirillum baldaniorum]|uniref:Uncharacterized protein n=1 Tax=Azospirillum baldaniorum TaxID=1064539 RepID=A0A9P1JT26_9PROT|nr:protein of unknown function [Azospirillum baldaniorum]
MILVMAHAPEPRNQSITFLLGDCHAEKYPKPAGDRRLNPRRALSPCIAASRKVHWPSCPRSTGNLGKLKPWPR